MNKDLKSFFTFLAVLLCFTCCDTTDTKYFEDSQNKGLSIFSDKANNIASAYFNEKPWKTRERTYNILSSTSYEVYIQKLFTSTTSDTLIIRWAGNIDGQSNYLPISLSFHMPVSKSFSAVDLTGLKGQRIFADGINSYFSVDGSPSLPSGKGSGIIYFHQVEIQLNSQANGFGKMAGLFEAQFSGLNITKGRFDHSLSPMHVQLP